MFECSSAPLLENETAAIRSLDSLVQNEHATMKRLQAERVDDRFWPISASCKPHMQPACGQTDACDPYETTIFLQSGH